MMPRALILGCAECVWDDAKAALELFTPDAIFAVKDMIAHWPTRIDYACTLHPEWLTNTLNQRRKHGFPMEFQIWAHKEMHSVPVDRTTSDWSGSSGLFAVKVAIEEGFERIVLAGVPMEEKANHFTRHAKWTAAAHFAHLGWHKNRLKFEFYVRSMSGWTKAQFGAPTKEWLEEFYAERETRFRKTEGDGRCPS